MGQHVPPETEDLQAAINLRFRASFAVSTAFRDLVVMASGKFRHLFSEADDRQLSQLLQIMLIS